MTQIRLLCLLIAGSDVIVRFKTITQLYTRKNSIRIPPGFSHSHSQSYRIRIHDIAMRCKLHSEGKISCKCRILTTKYNRTKSTKRNCKPPVLFHRIIIMIRHKQSHC